MLGFDSCRTPSFTAVEFKGMPFSSFVKRLFSLSPAWCLFSTYNRTGLKKGSRHLSAAAGASSTNLAPVLRARRCTPRAFTTFRSRAAPLIALSVIRDGMQLREKKKTLRVYDKRDLHLLHLFPSYRISLFFAEHFSTKRSSIGLTKSKVVQINIPFRVKNSVRWLNFILSQQRVELIQAILIRNFDQFTRKKNVFEVRCNFLGESVSLPLHEINTGL